MTEPAESAASIRRAALRLALRLRAERGAGGLPLLMLSVLGNLHRRGPLTAGELAAADRLKPQSLTRTLAGLEQQRLITRRPGEVDRRQSQIDITAEGRRRLGRDMQHRDAWLRAALTDALSPTEQELLRLAAPLMERLAEFDQ